LTNLFQGSNVIHGPVRIQSSDRFDDLRRQFVGISCGPDKKRRLRIDLRVRLIDRVHRILIDAVRLRIFCNSDDLNPWRPLTVESFEADALADWVLIAEVVSSHRLAQYRDLRCSGIVRFPESATVNER